MSLEHLSGATTLTTHGIAWRKTILLIRQKSEINRTQNRDHLRHVDHHVKRLIIVL
jgi:hypothetical protein